MCYLAVNCNDIKFHLKINYVRTTTNYKVLLLYCTDICFCESKELTRFNRAMKIERILVYMKLSF